jgi:hypothetical protein
MLPGPRFRIALEAITSESNVKKIIGDLFAFAHSPLCYPTAPAFAQEDRRPAMAYTMHRIFCSTPGELEAERRAFDDVVGEVNEADAMPKGILFVPLSIMPYIVNKLPYQPMVDANVRACRFFVQVLHHTWGPPTRNFESEYQLACLLMADPAEALDGIAVFFKAADSLQIVEPGILQLKSSLQSQQHPQAFEYAGLDDYKLQLRAQLSDWLRSV